MAHLQAVLILLGRVLIGGPFIIFGAALIPSWENYSTILTQQNIPAAPVFLVLAVAFLIIGGVSLILGYKARVGAILLMITLIAATFTVGGFSDIGEAQNPPTGWLLWNNIALFGGLIYVLTYGASTISLDRRQRDREDS